MENTKLWVFFWQTKGSLKIHITLACLSDLPLLSVLLFMKLLLTIFLPSPCCNPGCLSFLPTILLPRPFFQNLSSLVLDCFICLTQILWEASSVTGAMNNSNITKSCSEAGQRNLLLLLFCHCPQISISNAILSLGLSYCVSDIFLCLLAIKHSIRQKLQTLFKNKTHHFLSLASFTNQLLDQMSLSTGFSVSF